MTTPLELVQRLLDEVMNRRNHDLFDELWTPDRRPKLRAASHPCRLPVAKRA
jgi:hypothetical protein